MDEPRKAYLDDEGFVCIEGVGRITSEIAAKYEEETTKFLANELVQLKKSLEENEPSAVVSHRK